MNRGMQEHRMVHWLVGFVAASQLVFFATPSPAQAAVESVPPISGGTVWRTSWKGGSFPSAVAACSSLSPGDCPVCGSLSYVGTKPNPAYPDYMDCVVFYNPGDGTPGWNTLAGTAIPRSNAVCPVPTVNPTVPYQYKASSGMCEREAQCVAPNAINPATGKCEPPKRLIITLSGGSEVEPSNGSSIKTLPCIATVIDQNTNQPPPNPVTVKIALKVDPTSGGHNHGDSTRPRGGIAEKETCPTDGECWGDKTSNGTVVFNFNAPEASGTHTITATCEGCSNPATKSVDVKVEGLWPIFPSTYYALTEDGSSKIIGSTTEHTSNHYVTSEAQQQLWRLAQSFYEYQLQNGVANPTLLHLNDASPKWGGLFDRDGDWDTPHEEHRRGSVIDIRANSNLGAIPRGLTKNFEKIAKDLGIDPHLEYDNDPVLRHFHTRLLNRKE